MSEFKLCYVAHNLCYFTDNFENQWGDDWNDIPYEHNAETPYEYDEELDNTHRGHIRIVAFANEYRLVEPCDGTLNSSYSVQDINADAIAWLYDPETRTSLHAGVTIDRALYWFKAIGVKAGELV